MHADGPQQFEPRDRRCDALTTGNGTVVLYDQSNPDAWLESTVAVDFADLWADESA